MGDTLSGNTADTVGKVGPPGAARHYSARRLFAEGANFRMRGDDGQVRYTGYVAGEYAGPEPLHDFGTAHGCSRIEYLRDGKWEALDTGS